MNTEITPLSRKGTNRKFIAISILIALGATMVIYARNFVLADNQPSADEQLITINLQINEIEKMLMVRSQEYNENQKLIDEKNARNSELSNLNTADRKLKSELEAKKAELISGK